ncbi:SH3 domain-containing protein [Rhodobacteraceae bacterium PA1-206B]
MRIGFLAGLSALHLGFFGMVAGGASVVAGSALMAQEAAGAEPAAAPPEPAPEPAPQAAAQRASAQGGAGECRPGHGCVTNLPLPRFVSLKGDEGNARRGPGLTHRIDWVFTRPGMPLMITAEYENWRRVEDQEGAGGWVHYALLSGVRNVVVALDMAELRASADPGARVIAQAELGVVARLLECRRDWCRVSAGGERGWVEKTALWGVSADEILE